MMASTSQRYPLSTPDGLSIPLDVIKPHSIVLLNFTTMTASAVVAIPDGIEIASLYSTEDCVIQFGGTAAVPANGVNTPNALVLTKDVITVIAPPLVTLTAIGLSTAGSLRIQFIEKWAGLALVKQISGR